MKEKKIKIRILVYYGCSLNIIIYKLSICMSYLFLSFINKVVCDMYIEFELFLVIYLFILIIVIG